MGISYTDMGKDDIQREEGEFWWKNNQTVPKIPTSEMGSPVISPERQLANMDDDSSKVQESVDMREEIQSAPGAAGSKEHSKRFGNHVHGNTEEFTSPNHTPIPSKHRR